MRRSITAALVLTACFAAPGSALALNCDQARKYAATGRSADDIADTMVADVAEVKKCLAAPAADSKGSKAAGSAGAAGVEPGDKTGDQPPSAKNPN